MIIRAARKSDVNDLCELWQGLMDYHQNLARNPLKLKKNAKSIIKKFFIKNIKGKSALVLIAKDGRKPVGYLMGFVRQYPPVYIEDKMAYLSDGFISKEHRKKGIMKEMIKQTKSFFKKKNMKHIYLRADTFNQLGVNSWKRIGFKEECKEMYMKI